MKALVAVAHHAQIPNQAHVQQDLCDLQMMPSMREAASRSLRILHIIGTTDPAAGGPSESLRVLMAFSGSGYQGEVVSLDDPSSPFLKDLPFPVHALGPERISGCSLSLYKWLKKNSHRFDGFIINGVWDCCGVAVWLALLGRKPYMVFPHGMLDPYFKRQFPLKHAKKWIFWLLAEYWVLRNAHRVLFTTKDESELAEQSFWLHRWDGQIVPFGTGPPPKNTGQLKVAFHERCPELRGERFMLYLGRIHGKKGCDLLIRSFIKHASLDPQLHLLMAGPDQQGRSSSLQQEIADHQLTNRVHWPGMLKGDAKWGAFYASEAFILPSHQENFGIAVAEALSCGKAVLLTEKINIAPEITLDGAGLMASDTQDGIDDLLLRWIEMPKLRRALMERQAANTFQDRYNMEHNASSILGLFNSL